MTDNTPPQSIGLMRLKRRNAAETRFRLYGLAAVLMTIFVLGLLLSSIVSKGYSAFEQTYILIDISFDAETIGLKDSKAIETISTTSYKVLLDQSLRKQLHTIITPTEQRQFLDLLGAAAELDVRKALLSDPQLVGTTATIPVKASNTVDSYFKGYISRNIAESDRKIKDDVLASLDILVADDRIVKKFNVDFFTQGDSREPEKAGILGAVIGSFYTLAITLVLSFPIGVLTAIYMEEFAPRNNWIGLITLNINTLAAVPPIIYGLLGITIFLNYMDLQRAAPLVGGFVLALITLPLIIITSRAALQAVPPSIREAALGIGASRMQTVFHHVLPLAWPGIITGTILGMAQALGQAAPLLMIGMVAFIANIPGSITDAATVLPVQIFLWAGNPEQEFIEKTSAAIIVLLAFLVLMNTIAAILRKRFEHTGR